jgi:acetoacetyl-CoA reductase
MTKKLALVTGGTRGIGAAIAAKLQKDGHEVISTFIGHPEAAEKYSKETGIKTY